MLPKFSYAKATTLKEALDQLKTKDCAVYAGGTDLLGCMREEIIHPEKVVSISRIEELAGIKKMPDGSLRIGALTTITDIAENPIIKESYPALSQAASDVASPQLRNQGTIGGNLCQKPRCWYYRGDFHCLRKGGPLCFALGGENTFHAIFGSDQKCIIVHPSDTAPVLTSYGAIIKIVGPKGTRSQPIDGFFVPPRVNVEKETILEPDELVTEIIIPPLKPNTRSSYRKIRGRRSWDFAVAGVALALTVNNNKIDAASVVLSGAAPIPWRSKPVEEVLTGKTLNQELVEKAAQAVVTGAEPLQYNAYKLPLFQGVIREELTKIIKPVS